MENELMVRKDMNKTSTRWDRIHTGNFILQVQYYYHVKNGSYYHHVKNGEVANKDTETAHVANEQVINNKIRTGARTCRGSIDTQQ